MFLNGATESLAGNIYDVQKASTLGESPDADLVPQDAFGARVPTHLRLTSAHHQQLTGLVVKVKLAHAVISFPPD